MFDTHGKEISDSTDWTEEEKKKIVEVKARRREGKHYDRFKYRNI